MSFLTEMVSDLVIVAVVAAFCDMLLPDTGVKRPVQLVFGLYFMALMLNPLVALWTDTDLSAMDFSALGDVALEGAETEYDEAAVYREAASVLGGEIEEKLERIYEGSEASVFLVMEESGFAEAEVTIKGEISNPPVVTAEIQDLLVADYGIPKEVIRIRME
ncbi:MAG: stage III sporulation protein AF [Clostridia bacterium]